MMVQQPTANSKSVQKDFGRCRCGVNKTLGGSCAPSAVYTTRCFIEVLGHVIHYVVTKGVVTRVR